MTVQNLIEGLEEWKEINSALSSWISHYGIKNPEYGKQVERELEQAEQKIKQAIINIVKESHE